MLFDSWAPLMGKRGDLLYFFVWVGQMSELPAVTEGMGAAPVAIPVDFSGVSAVIVALSAYLDFHHITVGFGDFDRAKAPITLATWVWTGTLVAGRCLTALLACLPLLLAVRLFHRYSPDRVKPARSRARRSPLALLNGWLRPLARLARPLFSLAARVPGIAGQALADVALTLVSAPAAIALLLLAQVLALALDLHVLAPLALACVACWGVLVSDLPVRDLDAGCAALGAAVPGGHFHSGPDVHRRGDAAPGRRRTGARRRPAGRRVRPRRPGCPAGPHQRHRPHLPGAVPARAVHGRPDQ
jgi:hypothetical protein